MTEVLEQPVKPAPIIVNKPIDFAVEGATVRFLAADGTVSELCTVVDTTMRNNRIIVTPQGTSRRIPVNRRRLLPPTANHTATVLEAGDRYKALCPYCGKSIAFLSEASEAECTEHGLFPTYWLGVRPMSVDESSTGTKAPKAPKAPKPAKEKAPKAFKEATPKKQRLSKDPLPVDLAAIAALGELWTKSRVTFDHAHVDVKAHILLVGDRKHCFNTYNGSLGKKAKTLDMAVFQSPTGGFAVKNQEKERANLEKQGYELTQPCSIKPNTPMPTDAIQEAQGIAQEPESGQEAPEAAQSQTEAPEAIENGEATIKTQTPVKVKKTIKVEKPVLTGADALEDV